MAVDLKALEQQLLALMPKTAQRDEEALRLAAENKYTPIYNAETEGAQQAQQQSDLALAQQIERLLPEYERGIENIQGQVVKGVSDSTRSALGRGMQRSSFLNASNANIQAAGVKAIGEHERDYQTNVAQINQQRSQLEQQLAQTLGRLEADKAHTIAGYTDEMRQQDLQNAMAGYDSLQSIMLQLAQMGISQDQWQQQYNLSLSNSKSSGSSKSSSSAAASNQSPGTAQTAGTTVGDLLGKVNALLSTSPEKVKTGGGLGKIHSTTAIN